MSKKGRKVIDMTGMRFGRLTVIKQIPKPERIKAPGVWWECKCECGKIHQVSSGNLRNGKIKSCGCLRRDNGRARGNANRKKD